MLKEEGTRFLALDSVKLFGLVILSIRVTYLCLLNLLRSFFNIL